MAGISKEERERRAAARAAAEAAEQSAENTEAETTEAPEANEVALDPVEAAIMASAPPPEPESPYPPSERAMREVVLREMASEEKLSLDCIEQAAQTAGKLAAEQVRNSKEAEALRADPTNMRKRKLFLGIYGAGKNKPPRPIPGPEGHKDPRVLEWDALYEPEKFVEKWQNSSAPLIVRLRNEARARLDNR